jgi:ferredoxin
MTPQEDPVLVTVDYDRCEGHGLCTLAAPDVFSFDNRGNLQVVERPDPRHLAGVAQSVGACPALAITLTEASTRDATR